MSKPVILCILDGWGLRKDSRYNAITPETAKNFFSFKRKYSSGILRTNGIYVGLPPNQVGNSEVGHLTIGAGRIIKQTLPRINHSIESNILLHDKKLKNFINNLKKSKSDCHLLGLYSNGGVHSHYSHLNYLATLLAKEKITVHCHFFLDGRDCSPQDAKGEIKKFLKLKDNNPYIKLSTICGRYYAMDRDKRWERVKTAFQLIVNGIGHKFTDPIIKINNEYQQNIFDEFMSPLVQKDYKGIKNGDGLLFCNFRADRATQLLNALLQPTFSNFTRNNFKPIELALGMVDYDPSLSNLIPCLFTRQSIDKTLGEIIANKNLSQLRIAESEKSPHVTFFFDGCRKIDYPNSKKVLIPSPNVATYDLQPEMSAKELTQNLFKCYEKKTYNLTVLNYANPDMVGHSGNFSAIKKAIKCVDEQIKLLELWCLKNDFYLLIIADHGNAEEVYDPHSKMPHTAHTPHPVPIILVNAKNNFSLNSGSLCDVAPTVLQLLGFKKPNVMSGFSLLAKR